jgi:hypothetical protein
MGGEELWLPCSTTRKLISMNVVDDEADSNSKQQSTVMPGTM